MKYFAFILFSLSCLANILPHTEDIKGTPEIYQREYIETISTLHPYIQTFGLSTCVALIAYDVQTTETILAHIDAAVDIESEIPRLLRSRKFNITLVGGEYGKEKTLLTRISNYLKNKDIEHNSFLPQNENGMSVMVNTLNGEISTYHETYRATDYRIDSAKSQRLHTGGNRLSRHLDSLGGGDQLNVDWSRSEWDVIFKPY